MVDIKLIKKCAEDAKAILAKVKTVEDVISLRKIGISEDKVYSSDIVEQKEIEVRTKYQNGEIVLAADDYNGTTLVCTQLIGGDNVIEETGWNNI